MPAEPIQLSESFGWYLVARFELLDVQSILQQFDSPRGADGPTGREEFKTKVADLYEASCRMRETFMTAYDRFLVEGAVALGLTDAQMDSLQRLLRCKVRFIHHADCVLIYAPMRTDRNRIPAQTVFYVMHASMEMFSECLLASNRLQGWLDVGLGMEGADGAFYGPELAQLWDRKRAILQPRITVGKALYGYLKCTDIVADASNLERVINRRFADRCLEALVVDDNGILYLKL